MANCLITRGFSHDMDNKKAVQFTKGKIRIIRGAALEFAKAHNLIKILSDQDIIAVIEGEEGIDNNKINPTVDPKIAAAVQAAAPPATFTNPDAVVEGANAPDLV